MKGPEPLKLWEGAGSQGGAWEGQGSVGIF